MRETSGSITEEGKSAPTYTVQKAEPRMPIAKRKAIQVGLRKTPLRLLEANIAIFAEPHALDQPGDHNEREKYRR